MIDHTAIKLEKLKALAESAAEKHAAGILPTDKELNAAAKYEQHLTEKYGEQFVQSVPKKLYQRWVKRRGQTLNDQADAYGFPFRGETINLVDVLIHLHDFLKENQYKLMSPDDENGENSDRLRELKADIAEDERDTRRCQLIPREEARNIHTRWEQMLRSAGEDLGRRFGAEAQDILNEALDDCQQLIASYFGSADVSV